MSTGPPVALTKGSVALGDTACSRPTGHCLRGDFPLNSTALWLAQYVPFEHNWEVMVGGGALRCHLPHLSGALGV